MITLKRFPCHTLSLWRGKHRCSSHNGSTMGNVDVLFVVSLNKLLNKVSRCRWYEIPRYSCNVTILYGKCNLRFVVHITPLCRGPDYNRTTDLSVDQSIDRITNRSGTKYFGTCMDSSYSLCDWFWQNNRIFDLLAAFDYISWKCTLEASVKCTSLSAPHQLNLIIIYLIQYSILSVVILQHFDFGTTCVEQNYWCHKSGDECIHYHNIDGLAQDCSNSIANALELLQSCT